MTNVYFSALTGAGRAMATLLLLCITPSLYAHQPCENTGTYYVQDDSAGDGLVVMEAEWPSGRSPSRHAGHGPEVDWTERTRSTAGGGGYAIVATRDQNALDMPADGAQLEYQVEFTTAGTHYLYLRHAAPSRNDNSVRIAIDGVWFQQTLQLTPVADFAWAWQRATNSFHVESPGTYTITIAHREDGLPLDRIAISRNGARSFRGVGPAITQATPANRVSELTTLATYRQETDSPHNLVVLEAERPTRSVRGQWPYLCWEWQTESDPAASREQYVIVPDQDARTDSFDLWQAPRLDYEVKFKRTGRHYVYLRHRGTSPGNNSVWTDFDYIDEDEFQLKKNTGTWDWEMGGRNTSFVVSDTGTHIFSLYMREDGTPIDKIIITPDPHYRTSALGPDATECVAAIVYHQEHGGGNVVQMPAETPTATAPGTGAYAGQVWTFRQDDGAQDGKYAVVDDRGQQAYTSDEGARLDYAIDFVATGDHYLYLRHRARPQGNSVRVYFDDRLIDSHAALPVRKDNGWAYTRIAPAIPVTAPGRHTLTLRMREDGTEIDHLVMSTDPDFNARSLPIELASFTGTPELHANLLSWTSTREDNTDRHLIERLAPGRAEWRTVGTVAAVGNSTVATDYSFADRAPLPRAHYRLRTVDADGTESLSAIITLERQTRPPGTERTTLSVFPNPTTDRVTLRFTSTDQETVHFRVFTLTGQRVLSRQQRMTPGTNQLEVSLGTLPTGTYVLSANLGSQGIHTERIVVRH